MGQNRTGQNRLGQNRIGSIWWESSPVTGSCSVLSALLLSTQRNLVSADADSVLGGSAQHSMAWHSIAEHNMACHGCLRSPTITSITSHYISSNHCGSGAQCTAQWLLWKGRVVLYAVCADGRRKQTESKLNVSEQISGCSLPAFNGAVKSGGASVISAQVHSGGHL